MDLAIGTVQFGISYGIAGRNAPVPEAEVRNILACAAERCIRVLDTASAYGDIEPRLASLASSPGFKIVSKIRPKPALSNTQALRSWGVAEVLRSIDRIGPSLYALMFHRHEDLMDSQGEALWQACAEIARARGLKLGVSCYGPEALQEVSTRFPITITQLPANALDQRLARWSHALPPSLEIHVRSTFLQGLLLMPEAQARARLPLAAAALRRWHGWCDEKGISRLMAALGIVKGIKRATHCVVGIDSLAHFEEIADAWDEAPHLVAPELYEPNLDIIDPRQWALKPP